jgi:TATA-binding protein-associated factor
MIMQRDLGLSQPIWEVCHGGMIGLKYLVAVRDDLLLKDTRLMDGVIEAVMKGLGDYDDDVRAVSAATLVPIAEEFVTLRPGALYNMINIVWECLSNLQDDLSASTGAVMDLLAKLCTFPQVLDAMKENAAKYPEQSFGMLVPRLYPFLRHTITTVRSAVLRALLTFLKLEGDGTDSWVNGKALRLIFQNLLVERNEQVLKLSLQVWIRLVEVVSAKGSDSFAAELAPHVHPIIALTMHPVGVPRYPIPMNPAHFIRPSGAAYTSAPVQAPKKSPGTVTEAAPKRGRKPSKKEETPQLSHNVDGHMLQGDVDLVGADVLLRSKIYAAKALGHSMKYWSGIESLAASARDVVLHLNSRQSTTQLVAAMVIEEYAKVCGPNGAFSPMFAAALRPIVENERPACYNDIVSYIQVARAQCLSLLNVFRDHAHVSSSRLPTLAVVVQGDPEAGPNAFSIADAEKIVGPDFERLKKSLTPAQRVTASQLLNDAQANALTAVEDAKAVKEQRDMRIRAEAASAIVALQDVPKKPSHIIKGMMDSIKKEENFELQQRSAAAIASLVDYYTSSEKRGPVDKVISNLVKFYCQDTAETPEFHHNARFEKELLSLRKEEDRKDHPDAAKFEREAKEARIMRRGAREALEQLANTFGARLLDKVPNLKSLIEAPLRETLDAELPVDIRDPNSEVGQQVVDSLSTLRALVPRLDKGIHPWVIELMPIIV